MDRFPQPEPRPIPLTQLRSGQRATVYERQVGGDDCELLAAMGLTHECALRVCQAGEPCIIQVAATRLGLSKRMACRIMVVPEPAG